MRNVPRSCERNSTKNKNIFAFYSRGKWGHDTQDEAVDIQFGVCEHEDDSVQKIVPSGLATET